MKMRSELLVHQQKWPSLQDGIEQIESLAKAESQWIMFHTLKCEEIFGIIEWD